ncbi:MAG: hypothetical protein RLZZ31_1182 [Actinomycetota bacterium]
MDRPPVIIEAAINGTRTKDFNPHVPITKEEIANDALSVLAAGASIVHHHISVFGEPQKVADEYEAIWDLVLAERPDALLYPTANIVNGQLDFTHLHLLARSGKMKVTFSDPGSVNLGGLDAEGLPVGGYVYQNSFDSVRAQFQQCSDDRVGPSLAIYEPGFLRAAIAYWRAGKLPAGTMAKFYLANDVGYLGAPFGLPPTKAALQVYIDMIADTQIPWAVSVVGGDPVETGLARYAIERGGHMHIGLEFFGGARQPTNTELTNEAVALCAQMGVEVATTHQAAAILQLPRLDEM